MRNGYALATREGLEEIGARLRSATEEERDALRSALRIGVQWDVDVTLPGADHTVTQVYGSALPVAYGGPPAPLWKPFARLVLKASYEATLHAATLKAAATGCERVFLTLLGGGVFGNEMAWILDAMSYAIRRMPSVGLDLAVVSFSRPKPAVGAWIAALREPD